MKFTKDNTVDKIMRLMILKNANVGALDAGTPYSKFMDELVKLLASCPYAMITLAVANISGHLWTYIIFAFLCKREKTILNKEIAKIGLGLMWFALVLLPIYAVLYNSITVTEIHLAEIVITDLVISLVLQAVILAIVYFLHRKGKI